MAVRTIDTAATITEDRLLIVQVPPGVQAGHYRVIVLLEQDSQTTSGQPATPVNPAGEWQFPTLETAEWPEDMPLRRGDMYDDSGR